MCRGGLSIKQKESTKMFFKGSIYITDPCYIARDEDWMEKSGFDIENYTIQAKEFSDYLLEDTGIGDGSWKVYELPDDMTRFEDVEDIIEDIDQDFNEFKVIGEFCADAGMSCVVYKKEADQYNPDFCKEYKSHCCTLLKDFDGEIESYFDDDGMLHFIGIGNKSFFTA